VVGPHRVAASRARSLGGGLEEGPTERVRCRPVGLRDGSGVDGQGRPRAGMTKAGLGRLD